MEIFWLVLCFLLAESLIALIRFSLRKKEIAIWLRALLGIAECLFATAMAFLIMAGPSELGWVDPLLMGFYVALFIDGLAQLPIIVASYIHKNGKRWLTFSAISCLCGAAFLTFGIVNSQIVTEVDITFASAKLHHEYKLAFASDFHLGKSQPLDVSLHTLDMIKAAQPDYFILGGDVFDEFTKESDMNAFCSRLGEFACPVYFIYGNHEPAAAVPPAAFEKALTDNGVNILLDEFVPLASDLTLLGRADLVMPGRADGSSLVNPYPDAYLVVADHQPFEFHDGKIAGLDLQLSGHTHAGQLLPMNWVYSFGVEVHGEYRMGDSSLYISSGAGNWAAPLRTETGCHFELITLRPAP